MSWIFGIKQQQQPGVPQSENCRGGQPADSNDEKSKAELERSKMAYSFDSTALERAATAAKTLKEHDLSTKQVEARIAAMQAENARAIEEERRKTLWRGNQTRETSGRLPRQLARRERACGQRAYAARISSKQEESIKKQEQLRIATIERELQLRHKYDLEESMLEVQAKARAAR
uniref:ATPase family AAA domain-containing protein n=1 Tax=Ditylenchus dipsaci TaxID=166011 RepID=A0A915DNX8_9BILA